MSIQITLPDGSLRQVSEGSTPYDLALSISEGLARIVLVAEVDGQPWDLHRPFAGDCRLKLLKWEDEGGKYAFWHSSAHLLAEALEDLYPGIRLGIGPPIEQGFYYDIDFNGHSFGQDDFERVEQKMAELAARESRFERQEVSKSDALSYFRSKGDPYKLELIDGLNDGEITFYKQGSFTDLCRGPHIPHTGKIKAIKITSVAGAYWRGNEKNAQLTRIYAITFPSTKELSQHLALLEEAKKRDHRKLGRELELFTFSENVGMGLPLWLPRGALCAKV